MTKEKIKARKEKIEKRDLARKPSIPDSKLKRRNQKFHRVSCYTYKSYNENSLPAKRRCFIYTEQRINQSIFFCYQLGFTINRI